MIKTASVVGTAKKTAWSQAQAYEENGETVLIVLQLIKDEESDLADIAQVGGQLLLTLRQAVMGKQNLQEIREAERAVVNQIASGIRVSMGLGKIVEQKLLVMGQGKVVGYLKRGEQTVGLLNEKNMEAGVSGLVRPGDKLVLATEELEKTCGIEQLMKSTPEDMLGCEDLGVEVHKSEDSSRMAAVLAVMGSNEEKSEEKSEGRLTSIWDKVKSVTQQPLKINREDGEQRRKLSLIIGGITLAVLSVLVAVGFVRREQAKRQEAFDKVDGVARQAMTEATSIADLNPERARLVLSQAEATIRSYQETKPEEPYTTKATKLQGEVLKTEEAVFKITPVTLATLVELPVIAPGLAADRVALDGSGNILFTDKNEARIVAMNVADKSKYIFETGSVGKVMGVDSFGKDIYGLTDKGVLKVSQKQTDPQIVIQPDELWGKVTMMGMYAGNVYLLDQGNSEIWKYPVLTDGFGTRRRWFAVGIQPDLSKVTDMAVTGDIWLVTETGKLLRYTRGAPQKVTMEGFPAMAEDGNLANPTAVYSDSGQILVLEKGAKRVDVFDESGRYLKQYTAEEFGEATDLVVTQGKGYVLVGESVKWFSL